MQRDASGHADDDRSGEGDGDGGERARNRAIQLAGCKKGDKVAGYLTRWQQVEAADRASAAQQFQNRNRSSADPQADPGRFAHVTALLRITPLQVGWQKAFVDER